jgi:hypothetical protein
MKIFVLAALGMLLLSCAGFAQAAFDITGTPIPPNLLQQNYGNIPKGISAYDLNICNASGLKESIVSSRIYQALSNSNPTLEPIGREIMFAAILRNQNHSVATILNVVLNSTTGVLSVFSSSTYRLPSAVAAGAILASLSGQQLINKLKPILSADQLQKFESQVLEPALVLDGGSCIERTVFVRSQDAQAKSQALSFHIQ